MDDSFIAGQTIQDAVVPYGVRQFRAATRLPLTEIPSQGAARFQPKNLSIGGVFVLASFRPPVGSVFRLALWFAETRHEVEGRVTHHQNDGFGLSFISPSPELVASLRVVLDEHIPPIEREAYQGLKRTMYRELADRLRVAWAQGKNRYEATLYELSDKGVFLQTDIVPEHGSEIYVYLPRLESVGHQVVAEHLHAAKAEVRFRNSGLVGAVFVTPSAEFRVTIQKLLARGA